MILARNAFTSLLTQYLPREANEMFTIYFNEHIQWNQNIFTSLLPFLFLQN